MAKGQFMTWLFLQVKTCIYISDINAIITCVAFKNEGKWREEALLPVIGCK